MTLATLPGSVIIPDFILRKMYRKGSLRQTASSRFAFIIQNPLGEATITAPPVIVVNGIAYPPSKVASSGVNLASISAEQPFHFRKGDEVTLAFPGRLLRGGNRIHMTVQTKEFGEVEVYVEDKEAEFCEIPSGEEE